MPIVVDDGDLARAGFGGGGGDVGVAEGGEERRGRGRLRRRGGAFDGWYMRHHGIYTQVLFLFWVDFENVKWP